MTKLPPPSPSTNLDTSPNQIITNTTQSTTIDTDPLPPPLPPPNPSSWKFISNWPQLIKIAIAKQWFVLCVLISISLAYFFPKIGENGGPIHAEYTIKYGAVMVVFLLSGLSLKTSVLKQAVSNWRAHIGTTLYLILLNGINLLTALICVHINPLVIQLISLALVPALGFGVSKLLSLTSLNDGLIAGLVVCVCMPTTISSNVIMTESARGNEALSLINATLGNILGIVISPLLLLLYLGARTQIDFMKILTDIPITIIGPLLVGQLIRAFFPTQVNNLIKRVSFSTISSCMLLLLIYASFADNFAKGTLVISVSDVFAVIGVVWVMYPIFMAICFYIGVYAKFSRENVISIVFCGSTKTLSLGIPLIGIIYRGDPNNGLYSLPLLVYHASQLFMGGWAVGPLSKWVRSESSSPIHSESSLLPIVLPTLPLMSPQASPVVENDLGDRP